MVSGCNIKIKSFLVKEEKKMKKENMTLQHQVERLKVKIKTVTMKSQNMEEQLMNKPQEELEEQLRKQEEQVI